MSSASRSSTEKDVQQVRVNFDDYADSYNELIAKQLNFFSNDESYFAAYKIEIMRRVLQCEPKAILEFGCGIGRNLRYLVKAFPKAEITACDISEQSLVIARKDNPSVKVVSTEQALCTRYDLIFVAGVFHHIPLAERAEVMQMLARSLSPSGRLFVFEHNPYNPVTRRIVARCPFDEDAVLLKPQELNRLAQGSGLIKREVQYVLFFPGWLKSLRPLERKLTWLPLGGQYVFVASKV